jgi:SAM-dependent methyltransferase
VNAQLCRDLGDALAVWRTHPPPHFSFDGLAVTTHRIAPSSPVLEQVVGMERRQLSWQRGRLEASLIELSHGLDAQQAQSSTITKQMRSPMNNRDAYYAGLNEKLLESINSNPQKCLEIGCANGRLGRALKKRFPSLEYIGLDISKQAVAEASAYLDRTIEVDISTICDDEYASFFDYATFDLIILGDVLEHLPRPEAVLKGLKQVSRAETVLHICVPNMSNIMVIERLLTGDFDYDNMGILDDTHLRFYTPSLIVKHLLNTGWLPNIVDSYCIGIENSPQLSRLTEAATSMGIPAEKTLSNFSISQIIVKAQPYNQGGQDDASYFPGLSVIVPVNRQWQYNMNADKSPGLKEIGAEIIPIYNASSAAQAYTDGCKKASHAWRLFMHQDVYLPKGCGYLLAKALNELDTHASRELPIGFAGMSYLDDNESGNLRTQVNGIVLDRTHNNSLIEFRGTNSAITLDELGIILHKDSDLRIDPSLGWHVWGTDLCMQAWEKYGAPCSTVLNVPIFHNSTLVDTPKSWHDSAELLTRKWPHRKPISTLCGVASQIYGTNNYSHQEAKGAENELAENSLFKRLISVSIILPLKKIVKALVQ